MKFLSIGCNNLCSAESDSFETANNSSSVAVVKREEVWAAGRGGKLDSGCGGMGRRF